MRAIRFLLCLLAILARPVVAQFFDQGLVNAIVRTDYNSLTEGTSSNSLTFGNPCTFSTAVCGNSPTIYSATNSFVQNTTGYPQSNYWVLDFNNEYSYNQRCPLNPVGNWCTPGVILFTTTNPGPPNQSIARSPPGYGLMGFTTLIDSEVGENFYRAHLVLNGTFPNPIYDGMP